MTHTLGMPHSQAFVNHETDEVRVNVGGTYMCIRPGSNPGTAVIEVTGGYVIVVVPPDADAVAAVLATGKPEG